MLSQNKSASPLNISSSAKNLELDRLSKITDITRTMFAAPIATLSLPNTRGSWRHYTSGLDAHIEGDLSASFSEPLITHGEVLFVEDAASDPRFEHRLPSLGDKQLRSFLCVPLKTPNGTIGALSILSPAPAAFDRSQLPALRMLADLAVETLMARAHQREAKNRAHILQLSEKLTGAGYGYFNRISGEIYITDRVREIQGFEPGTNFDSLDEIVATYHPRDRELLQSHLTEALEHGKAFELVLRMQKACGTIRLVKVQVEPDFFEDDPTVYGLLGAIVDITEAHQEKQRLEAAEKMATLGTMVASLSHEMKTPLCYALANVQLLRDGAWLSPEDFSEILDDIETGLIQLSQFSKDLLDFSHSAPQDPTVESSADVMSSLKLALRLCAGQSRHVAHIALNFQESLPAAHIGENHLVQILINLINNAVQALSTHSPADNRITVSAYQRHADESSASRNFLVIEIEDNGPGMPPHVLHQIFDPFFTTKTRGKGCGLGLVVCRQLAESHGGMLTASSEQGKGSTFKLTLPESLATSP